MTHLKPQELQRHAADRGNTPRSREGSGARMFASALLAALVVGIASGCSSKPAAAVDPEVEEMVRVRREGFKEVSDLYKKIGDALKKGQPLQGDANIQFAVQQIANYAAQQSEWFGPGTGPESGVKTDALAEIWSDRPDFDKKAEAFLAESNKLIEVYGQGDDAAFAAQFKAVGVSCQNCHKKYRAEGDD